MSAGFSANSSPTPRLRFAPTPNGLLHLGHAFSALFTARAAKALGGAWLLRLEDIDWTRSRQEFEAAIREDLAWLGLAWQRPELRQSSRFSAYRAAADRLREHDLLYPCFCTRRQSEASASGAVDPDGAPLYPGRCRALSATAVASRLQRGDPVQWRLKMDRAAAAAGALTVAEAPASRLDALWQRAVIRPVTPSEWGDAVIVRKDTPTSYHLSVVVDDAAQGISHVTRGADLYAATSLHALLQKLLGLPAPVYCHHRLLLDEAGHKLSKSKGAPSLRSLREAGWTAATVRTALGFDEALA